MHPYVLLQFDGIGSVFFLSPLAFTYSLYPSTFRRSTSWIVNLRLPPILEPFTAPNGRFRRSGQAILDLPPFFVVSTYFNMRASILFVFTSADKTLTGKPTGYSLPEGLHSEVCEVVMSGRIPDLFISRTAAHPYYILSPHYHVC